MAASSESPEVAVVGGGIAGLYCAWRLHNEAEGRFRVRLYEGSDRLGGRLLTVELPGMDGGIVELGAMRHADSHRRLARLLKKFHIESYPFPVHEQQNILYLRGARLRWQDRTDAAALPYRLCADERTETALTEGFVVRAAERVLRQVLKREVTLSEQDWQEARSAAYSDGGRGYALHELPLRYVLQRSISAEALRFADDISGYDSILSNWNAFDGLRWNTAEFRSSQRYSAVRHGFAALVEKLADPLKRKSLIETGRTVTEIRPSSDVKLELRFASAMAPPVRVDRVILAMPRRAIELVDTGMLFAAGGIQACDDRKLARLLRSVTPIPLFKLALCYPFAWWETIDPVALRGLAAFGRIERGQSVTDLPIRQCYYWHKDPVTNRAAVLVYDDGRDLDYWSGLRDCKRQPPFLMDRHFASAASSGGQYNAPDPMVREAHRQLIEMHGVTGRCDIPLPYAAVYKDWNEDPYAGGVNFWSPSADSARVSQAILQPDENIPLFICGEAFSERHQGWIEGALDTANRVLEKFDLKEPVAT